MRPLGQLPQNSIVFLFAILALITPPTSSAGPCTPGVDCYCDRVRNGSLKDTNLLMCEDFEAPTLRGSSGVGQGAPFYGPWYDDTGQPGNRGVNSYWFRNYGNGVGQSLFSLGQPANPAYGTPCTYNLCVGEKTWDAANRWNANGLDPFFGVFTGSDFNLEIPTLSAPVGKAGGGSGAFDGAASLAWRIQAGAGHNNGITGRKYFGGKRTTFGITMAMAYPGNLAASGIMDSMWKHNEWEIDPGVGGGDGLFMFGENGSVNTHFPFYQFIFGLTNNPGPCLTSLNTASVTAGTFECSGDGGFKYRARYAANSDPTNPNSTSYSRTQDWPLGSWGCVEGYFRNIGTSNSSIDIWFTGPAGVRKHIVGISGVDLSQSSANYRGQPGYTAFLWNAYANANQPGGIPTTQTTFRYEDNIHITAGAPVSCAQIGFNSSAPAPAPAPAPSIDTIAPTVSITSPASGTVIKVN
jgi:hypothetical protein